MYCSLTPTHGENFNQLICVLFLPTTIWLHKLIIKCQCVVGRKRTPINMNTENQPRSSLKKTKSVQQLFPLPNQSSPTYRKWLLTVLFTFRLLLPRCQSDTRTSAGLRTRKIAEPYTPAIALEGASSATK